jgi:hypothetical protein
MTFSEFFHDITKNITEVRPSNKAFVAAASVTEPVKFINSGTRTGNDSTGAPNKTDKWTDTDSKTKVDVISSATYGDGAHFVPTKNLKRNYENAQSKADNHEVEGINAVEVGVDIELYANADLLRQATRAEATSTAVLTKVNKITWKESTEVYKAKYLWPDASWGKRDTTAKNENKGKAWPKAIGGNDGATVGVSYGGNWADKVISVDFAPLPADLSSADLWNNYFDYVYAGYVEDLQTGHKEPLVWLQNLFSHRGHSNLEAAIERAGFSRMDKLSPAGNMKVVMFAQGYKDIVAETTVAAYDGQSSAAIEQGSAFYVSGTGSSAEFKDNGGNAVPDKELHVTGLSAAALADFAKNGGILSKGTAVSKETYDLVYEEEDGEVAIKLKDDFFTGSFQGTYSFNITSDTQYKAITFAVNRIVDALPQLTQGNTTSANGAISVTTGGGKIEIDNEEFAKALVTTGNPAFASSISPAATGAIKRDDATSPYYIEASALTAGTTYTLTLRASGFANSNRENISPVVYTITVQ